MIPSSTMSRFIGSSVRSRRGCSADRMQADTPGCTSQACGFRDHFDRIKELGYEVYGLSKDKPAAQKKVRFLHTCFSDSLSLSEPDQPHRDSADG